MADKEVLLSTKEAADYLGVHRKTLYNWTKAEKLPAIVQALRYRKSDLDALAVRTLAPPPKSPHAA